MRRWGQVLSLQAFKGPIELYENKFINNQIRLSSCDIASSIQSSTNTQMTNQYQSILNRKFTQLRGLISIIDTTQTVIIAGNVFMNNTAIKGLIYIDSFHRTTPVLIDSNTFKFNGAYYGASAIFIRAKAELNRNMSQINSISEVSIQCGGYQISSNFFERNIGCPTFQTPVVEFNCANLNTSTASNDLSFLENFETSETFMEYLKALTESPQQTYFSDSSLVASLKGSNIITHNVLKKRFVLKNNIYLQNYASGSSGIVSIRGAQFFMIMNDTFKDNGDSFDEKFLELNTLMKSSNKSSFSSLLSSTFNMKAHLYLERAYNMSLQDVTFQSGYKLQNRKSSAYAYLIFIADSRGPLNFRNVTFRDLQGIGSDSSAVDNTIRQAPSLYQSSQSLIEFSNTYLSQINLVQFRVLNVSLVGLPSSAVFSNYPQILPADSGAYDTIYNGLRENWRVTQRIRIDQIQIDNFTCSFCNSYLLAFSGHDFTITRANVSNINHLFTARIRNEQLRRSGIFGFYHMPIPTKTNLTLVHDSKFRNIHGSLLRFFHIATEIVVNYTVSNTDVLDFFSVERSGGIFVAIGSILESPQINMTFMDCNFTNVLFKYIVTEDAGAQGGFLYFQRPYSLYLIRTIIFNVLQESSGNTIWFETDIRFNNPSMTLLIEDSVIYTNCTWCLISIPAGMSSHGAIYWPGGYAAKTTIISRRNKFTSTPIPFSYDGALFDLYNSKAGTYLYDEGSLFDTWAAVQGGIGRIVTLMVLSLKDTVIRNVHVSNVGAMFMCMPEGQQTQYEQNISLSNVSISNVSALQGGVIYMVGNTEISLDNWHNLRIENSQMRDITANDGGIINYSVLAMKIDIVNTSFIDVSSKVAGLIRAYSRSLLNNTFINFDNVTYLNTKVSGTQICDACVFSVVSVSKNTLITINNSSFKGDNSKTQLMTFFYVSSSVFNSNVVLTGNNFIGNINSQYNGCVFYLVKTNITSNGTTIFQDIASKSGMIFLSESTVYFQGSQFTNIRASESGGIIQTNTLARSFFTFDRCNMKNISAQSGAIAHISSLCLFEGAQIAFVNTIMDNLRTEGANSILYANTQNCPFLFENTQISNFSVSSMNSLINYGVRIEEGKSLVIKNLTILDMDSILPAKNSFIYVTTSSITVDIRDSNVKCTTQNESASQGRGYSSVFSIQNARSYISANNNFSDCYNGDNGIHYLIRVPIIQDSNSKYQNVRGSAGTAYYIQGLTDSSSQILINSNTYTQNQGSSGLIFISDTYNATLTNLTFKGNQGQIGGIIYSQELSRGQLDSLLTVTDCSFKNNKAAIAGGILWIGHSKLIVTFNDIEFSQNYGYSGGVAYLQQTKSILFQNSNFTQNSALQGLVLYSDSQRSNLTFLNCLIDGANTQYFNVEALTFRKYSYNYSTPMYIAGQGTVAYIINSTLQNFRHGSKGGLFYLSQSTLRSVNSKYSQNFAILGGVVYCYACSIDTNNNEFQNNSAIEGGVFYAESDSQLKSISDKFLSNSASQTGVMAILSGTSFYINNGMFINNNASQDSVLTATKTSSSEKFVIQNSIFQENNSTSNTQSFQESYGLIQNCSFLNNSAVSQTKGLYLSFSTITIQDSTFDQGATQQNGNQLFGTYLFSSFGVNLNVIHSTFTRGNSQNGGAIYISGLSNLMINDSTFSYNQVSQSGGSIYLSGYKKLTVINSTFNNNQAQDEGGDIYAVNSGDQSLIQNSIINDSGARTSIYLSNIRASLRNLTIDTNSGLAIQGAGVQCINCQDIEIVDSKFTNLQAQKGGAVYVRQVQSTGKLSIENSVFSNNSASNGASVYLENPGNVKVQNSNFYNNSATLNEQGSGGAIYHECQSSSSCPFYNISGSYFNNNIASNQGGALKWTLTMPNIQNSTFLENNASLYGKNIASFPDSLNKYAQLRALQATKISNVISGSFIPSFQIALNDHYDQVVSNINSAILNAKTTSTGGNQAYSVYLEGTQSFVSQNGVFSVEGLTLVGMPGSKQRIEFSSDIEIGGLDQINISLEIELRKCISGEYFSDSGKQPFILLIAHRCIYCEGPQTYAIGLQTEPGSCMQCPLTKAQCFGGSNIGPQPGYWRSSSESEIFIKCYKEAACLGSKNASSDPKGECFEGYRGVLCADCDANYGKSGYYSCGGCPSNAINIVRITIVLLATMIAVLLLIRLTLKGAAEDADAFAIYFKILMNHFQLIGLTQSYELLWPPYIQEFFQVTNPIMHTTDQIFSVDCLINSNFVEQENKANDYFNSYYVKLMLMAILPFFTIFICFLFWKMHQAITKQSNQFFFSKTISCVIIALFFFYANFIQMMLSAFQCDDINGESRLHAFLEIKCFEGPHKFWTLWIALPSILLWGLGIPMFAFVLLRRNQMEIDKIETKEKYGFLYKGFKTRYYFWEILVVYRKAAIAAIASTMASTGAITQALFAIVVIGTCAILNIRYKPFSQSHLNILESMSLISSIITLYCGIFFISDQSSEQVSAASSSSTKSTVTLTDQTYNFFFAAIVISNLSFFIYFGYKFVSDIKFIIMKKSAKLYYFLCVCRNQERFDRDKRELTIKDITDKLRFKLNHDLKMLSQALNKDMISLDAESTDILHQYLSVDKVAKRIKRIQTKNLEQQKLQEEQKYSAVKNQKDKLTHKSHKSKKVKEATSKHKQQDQRDEYKQRSKGSKHMKEVIEQVMISPVRNIGKDRQGKLGKQEMKAERKQKISNLLLVESPDHDQVAQNQDKQTDYLDNTLLKMQDFTVRDQDLSVIGESSRHELIERQQDQDLTRKKKKVKDVKNDNDSDNDEGNKVGKYQLKKKYSTKKHKQKKELSYNQDE